MVQLEINRPNGQTEMDCNKGVQIMWTAYIAANEFTPAFDTAVGKTAQSAIAAVKRKNSPDWQDCTVWATDDKGNQVNA
jgi:hypothetical protein